MIGPDLYELSGNASLVYRQWTILQEKAMNAQDLYRAYMDCEGDEIDQEDARFRFHDAALAVLQDIAGEIDWKD